jgi:hypothetical protein
MEKIIKELKLIYWGIVSVLLLFAFLVEFVLIDVVGGVFADDKQFEFIMQSLMSLLTLSAIYMSLRLFKFEKVVTAIREYPLEQYKSYSILRMVLLECPLLFNIICYWLFVQSSFAWLGVIIGLAFPFVYPSKERFLSETGSVEE